MVKRIDNLRHISADWAKLPHRIIGIILPRRTVCINEDTGFCHGQKFIDLTADIAEINIRHAGVAHIIQPFGIQIDDHTASNRAPPPDIARLITCHLKHTDMRRNDQIIAITCNHCIDQRVRKPRP